MSEPKNYSRSWFYKIPLAAAGAGALILAVMHIVALLHVDSECDDALLREWMALALVMLFLIGVPLIIIELFVSHALASERTTRCYKTYFITIGSVLAIWCGVGLCLLTKDDECASDFNEGYVITLVTCAMYFFFLGIGLPLYFMSNAFGLFEPEKKTYEPIE